MAKAYLGFAPWAPNKRTKPYLAQVLEILDDYDAYLPLTGRQVFYRMVAVKGYPKDDNAYERIGYLLQRGRRSGRIPWSAIRDDGGTFQRAGYWDRDEEDVRAYVRRNLPSGYGYTLDPQAGQPVRIEVWCEAAGMVPMVAGMVRDYGINAYSSGGFDSLTAKHEAYRRFRGETRTRVLHVGDFDPSGESVFDSAEPDIMAFGANAKFERVAVLEAHIAAYSLPTAPPKATDNRKFSGSDTVQAEALDPAALEALLVDAIGETWDSGVAETLRETEQERREEIGEIVESVAEFLDGEAS